MTLSLYSQSTGTASNEDQTATTDTSESLKSLTTYWLVQCLTTGASNKKKAAASSIASPMNAKEVWVMFCVM